MHNRNMLSPKININIGHRAVLTEHISPNSGVKLR